MMSESDTTFLQKLYEFINQEKKNLQCPEEGPNELRYIVYRSAFNKVIGRTTAFKRLLLIIKSEYDNIIRQLKRREKAEESEQSVVNTCQRLAAELNERTTILQTHGVELQEDIRTHRSINLESLMKGLSESEDPDVLQKHLKDLEIQKALLMDYRSQGVPLEVQTELEAELQAAERHRDQLSFENKHLRVLFMRLSCVVNRLTCWEQERQEVPLEGVLGSTLQNIQHLSSEPNDEGHGSSCNIDSELFEDEEPTGVDESKLLQDHLDSFVELLESAQYEEAALHAARSPRGVLRNADTMELFAGVQAPPASTPPALLFFRALLFTTAKGDRLSGDVSLQGVRCSLQHGNIHLVTHAVSQDKLMFTEELGDILTEHAQNNHHVLDQCLALASIVYEACKVHRKTALSMCRRGLTHSAAEFMKLNLTADDCMWVLTSSSNPTLLQLLTEPSQGQVAILPVGRACSALLVDPQQHRVVLQLLDSLMSREQDVLENVILEDSSSSVDVWDQVASRCSDLNRADLSRAIRSILLRQNGTGVLSSDPDGARLMEHVFL
nr:clathrin heavy chain linker domain-containing protein 1 [Nothobranchius furzeri]